MIYEKMWNEKSHLSLVVDTQISIWEAPAEFIIFNASFSRFHVILRYTFLVFVFFCVMHNFALFVCTSKSSLFSITIRRFFIK